MSIALRLSIQFDRNLNYTAYEEPEELGAFTVETASGPCRFDFTAQSATINHDRPSVRLYDLSEPDTADSGEIVRLLRSAADIQQVLRFRIERHTDALPLRLLSFEVIVGYTDIALLPERMRLHASGQTERVRWERLDANTIRIELKREALADFAFSCSDDAYHDQVVSFLTDLRDIVSVKEWHETYSYQLACMLKATFRRGEVMWCAPDYHMVWQDVTGECFDIQGPYRIPKSVVALIPADRLGEHIEDFTHTLHRLHPFGIEQEEIDAIIDAFLEETADKETP